VVDPSFRGTDVEIDLETAAGRGGFEVRWHRGSELPVERVPDDFRGPEYPWHNVLAYGRDAADG